MGIKYLHSIPHLAVAQEVHHTVLHGVELCEQLSGAVGGAGERIVNDHGSYMRAVLYHAVDTVQQAVAKEYEAKTGIKETFYVCKPSQGAGQC